MSVYLSNRYLVMKKQFKLLLWLYTLTFAFGYKFILSHDFILYPFCVTSIIFAIVVIRSSIQNKDYGYRK